MTVLVLGGAGYIGSHTVYALIEKGEDVVIVDNLETGHIEAIHPQARFYEGDIRDRAFIDSVSTCPGNPPYSFDSSGAVRPERDNQHLWR